MNKSLDMLCSIDVCYRIGSFLMLLATSLTILGCKNKEDNCIVICEKLRHRVTSCEITPEKYMRLYDSISANDPKFVKILEMGRAVTLYRDCGGVCPQMDKSKRKWWIPKINACILKASCENFFKCMSPM